MNRRVLLMLSILMMQNSFSSLVTSLVDSQHICACRAQSQSFFSIRPVYTVNSPEYLAHNRDFYKKLDDLCYPGTIQLTALGGTSTHNDAIAKFFLPFCSTALHVTEQQTETTDILAQQFNIYTQNGTFDSTVEFHPRHSYAGLGINYQQRIYERCNGKGVWLSISGPILSVHNRIELVESITNNGGGPLVVSSPAPVASGCPESCPNSCNPNCNLDPAQALPPVDSVIAAFRQPGWCFGRIDNLSSNNNHHRVTKIGDITIRIGYETVNREDCHLDSFFGIIVPTGNRPAAISLFEPIVGHNHHWGIVLGSTLGMEIWQSCTGNTTVCTELDFSISDFFARRERRSFDLKYKPWSRYMQFYKNVTQAQLAANSLDPVYALTLHTPGIDILTQDLKVKPGYYRTFNSAFIVSHCCFELELGYNFFARQAECIKLDCDFPTGTALKAIGVGSGVTGKFQTINNDFSGNCTGTPVTNYANNIITVDDIDLESAAHTATLTHTFYASLAYQFEQCGFPMFAAIGGSYEFPPDNVGLNRWMAWGKFGIAF